eukprot:scaffold12337_cov19-Tisochrysis_lutea.AAC.1
MHVSKPNPCLPSIQCENKLEPTTFFWGDVITGTMAAVAALIFSGLVANLVVVQASTHRSTEQAKKFGCVLCLACFGQIK